MDKQNVLSKEQFYYERRQDKPAPQVHDHYHKGFEVYYLEKGTCWYFIDHKSYRLSAGDIALIPAGVIHKTSYETRLSSRSVFNCDDSFLPSSVRGLLRDLPYFSRADSTAEQVESLFRSIRQEYESPDRHAMDALRSYVAQLFLLIARESGKCRQEKKESPIVERAVEYIHSHYAETVSLQAAAEHCYVSREHLSRIFKKETGFGFNEYLNIYRLKIANAQLQKDPKRQISLVALSCGFNDSNYFTKQYKKIYGITPTKERKGER